MLLWSKIGDVQAVQMSYLQWLLENEWITQLKELDTSHDIKWRVLTVEYS